MSAFLQLPSTDHFWLKQVRVPLALMANSTELTPIASLAAFPHSECLAAVDIEIQAGKIHRLVAADTWEIPVQAPTVCLNNGLVWPCFVDAHTHLDKGHIWPRQPNPDGTFDGALSHVAKDREQYWQAEDVYQRMNFGLKCSYAHGTQAIRTHLDSWGDQAAISFEVFRKLQAEWAGRLTLQAVCLAPLDYFLSAAGEALAAQVAATPGGIFGGVAFISPDTAQQLDRVFDLAKEYGLDLDFHCDESLDPTEMNLYAIAEAKLRHPDFAGRVTCSHCCSLSVQSPATVATVLAAVKASDIAMISLPMCNLYLQDRQPGRMPRYRGATLLHEIKQQGIPIAVASDNCRDPFFAYGDHDGLEVFTQSVRIGHLDRPYGDWPQSVTHTPAQIMGLSHLAQIGVGLPADLICFKARTLNELLARPQCDRIVIRQGRQIDTTLPDYSELDTLRGYAK